MSTELIDETTRPAPAEIESIHLTPGSVKPAWLAATILATLAGLFAFRPLLIVGVIACALIAWSWISEARAESDELPLT